MKKLIMVSILAVGCLVTPNTAKAENDRGLLDPHFYIAPIAGVSWQADADESNHKFHNGALQLGATLFNTEKLQFIKLSFGWLFGRETDAEANDGHAHPSVVFSPIVFKIVAWDYGSGASGRTGALTFDVGVDQERRLVGAFGFSL